MPTTRAFDVTAMGAARIRFRSDSMRWRVRKRSCRFRLRVGAVTLCDLDIDGDGSVTVARDGTLLLRYLMGFRGTARAGWFGHCRCQRSASHLADYVGLQFDVFGRTSAIRLQPSMASHCYPLMLGMSDDVLLNGIARHRRAHYLLRAVPCAPA